MVTFRAIYCIYRSSRVNGVPALSTPRLSRWMIGLIATVLLIGTTASAQQASEQTESPASNQIEKHVHNYGDVDNTCIRWTDQCHTCNRSTSGAATCSNIGIACQPTGVECLERRQDAEKK
jgi:hypothetical protein